MLVSFWDFHDDNYCSDFVNFYILPTMPVQKGKVKSPNEKLTAHCVRKYTINLLAKMSKPTKLHFE